MPVTLTQDEFNTFKQHGATAESIQNTVNHYRSQGLDDTAIRAKIDAKLNSWKVQQPQPQPKNVVPNRPANQELKVEEQPQELNPDAQPSATQLQGGVEKKYIEQDGYYVDTETGEKTPIGGMEIRKPDDLTSLSPKQLKNYLRSQDAIKRAANWERLHNAIPAIIRDYEFLTPIFKQEEQYQATHPNMSIQDQITQRLKGMAGSVPGLVNIGLLGKTWGIPSIAKQSAIVGAGLKGGEAYDKALNGEDSWWKVPLDTAIGGVEGLAFGKVLGLLSKGLNSVRRAEVMKNWNTPLAKRLEAKGKSLPVKEEVQPQQVTLEQPQQNNIAQPVLEQPQQKGFEQATNEVIDAIKNKNLPTPDEAYKYSDMGYGYLRDYVETAREANHQYTALQENLIKQRDELLAKAKTEKRKIAINKQYNQQSKAATEQFDKEYENLINKIEKEKNNIANQPQQAITQQLKLTPSQEANNIINTQKENLIKELDVDNINEIAKPEYSKEMRDEAINIIASATGKHPTYVQMIAKAQSGGKGIGTKNSRLQELLEGGSENITANGSANNYKYYGKQGLTYDDTEIEGGYNTIQQAWDDLVNDNFYINKELSQYDNMLGSADNKIKETFKNLIDDPENFANNVAKYSDEVTEYLEKNVPEQDRGQFYDAFYNGLDKINQYADNVNGLKAGTKKVRGLAKSKHGDIAKTVGDEEKLYDARTHAEYENTWNLMSDEEKALAINNVDDIRPEVQFGKAQLVKNAIANGEPVSKSMMNGVAKNLTKAGQEVEASKFFMPTTPEGIAMEVTKLGRETAPKGALKVIDNADKIAEQLKSVNTIGDVEKILKKNGISTSKIGKNRGLADDLLNIVKNNQLGIENLNGDRLIDLVQKRYKIANFGVDDYAKAEELTNKFANATTQREKDIALGYIKKFILSKEQRGKVGNRLKAWRFANMLGSVPSRSADLLSTATYQGVRAVDEAIAKTISKAFNTGTRSGYSSLNPAKWAKNVWENAKIGAEDTELGINTLRMGDKDGYHLGSLPQFEGTPLEGWEKLVRHSVNDPDRAFHGGKYQSSYDDLMATGNFTEEEAKEIAAKEALDNVFQGNGFFAKNMTNLRNLADKATGSLQVGSHLMPFVKTPTNLIIDAVNRGLPIDLARGIYKFNKATSLAEKREAEDLIAKGITGQAITWGGGYGLNKLANNIGQINASDTFGDDVTGLAPQSVVIGNKGYSLSNVPYLSIPMAIGKELTNTEKDIPDRITSALANAFSAGMSLPAIKTFGDLTKTGNDLVNAISSGDTDKMGKQITTSLSPIASNIISSYFPFSGIEGNVRTALDPYNREVRSDDFATSVLSRVYNRTPASNKLPMKYNVEGNPSMRTNIENPVGRWAEALLSPVKIRNYNEPSELKQQLDTIQDLMKDSDIQGKTQISYKQMPRSVKVNGKSIRLEGEQYSEAQRLYGKLQTKYKQEILNNKSWTDEQKAKKLAEVSTNANEAIRIELLGHKPKDKKGKYTNRMIDDIKNGDL